MSRKQEDIWENHESYCWLFILNKLFIMNLYQLETYYEVWSKRICLGFICAILLLLDDGLKHCMTLTIMHHVIICYHIKHLSCCQAAVIVTHVFCVHPFCSFIQSSRMCWAENLYKILYTTWLHAIKNIWKSKKAGNEAMSSTQIKEPYHSFKVGQISVDSNILVDLLLADIQKQSRKYGC